MGGVSVSDVNDLHPRVGGRMSRAFFLALVCVLLGAALVAACSDDGAHVVGSGDGDAEDPEAPPDGRSPQGDGALPPEVVVRELVRPQEGYRRAPFPAFAQIRAPTYACEISGSSRFRSE